MLKTSTQTPKSKFLRYFFIYLLFIFVAVNFYLKHSNILIYSNATDNVGILDVKWEMSPAEIVQVTHQDYELITLNSRGIKTISQKLVISDNKMSEVNYYFVDNQLYKVSIKKSIESSSQKTVNEFIKTVGFNTNGSDMVSGLYAGEKFLVNEGKEKKSLYIGFDSSNKPKNTYVTMAYEPLAKKL